MMMKKSIRQLTVLITAILLLNIGAYTNTFCQTVEKGKAFISNEYVLSLDSTQSIQSEYEASIATLSLASSEEAIQKFNFLTDNLVSFQVDWTNKAVFISIKRESADSGWTVHDWNNYFELKAQWK